MFLVLSVDFKMSISASNPIHTVPVRASCKERTGVLGQRMKGQAMNENSENLWMSLST